MNRTAPHFESVALTGAAGWLGGRVLELLLAEMSAPDGRFTAERVVAFVRPGEPLIEGAADDPRVSRVEGDVREPDDARRFADVSPGGTLIHTAGIIHPRRVAEFFEVNVEGTRNVLDAFAAGGACARAVVVSSNSPIGVSRDPSVVFTEESPYDPYMNYGRSKVAMERLISEMNAAARLDVVVVRPPWFYGVNQPARQSEFFRMIRDGKVPIVGSGENRRSMAYLDNIYDGLVLALTVPAASRETFWIADARPYTMNEIVDTIEDLLEHEFDTPCAHKRTRLPDALGELATRMDAVIQGTGRYQQKIHVLSEMNKTIACSIDKARRVLGYEPAVELREGMRRSLRWVFERRGGI
ncbi:MAG: NAD(P)-dependent oxidoreductase [Candidatus Baltobacteraceae bacterium]